MKSYFLVRCITMLLAVPGVALAADAVNIVPGTSIANPRQPQAAVTEQGTIYVAFGAEDSVYVSVSLDGGSEYREPVKVDSIPGLALGLRRGPRIVAAKNGVVVVSAIGHTGGDLCGPGAQAMAE